MVSVDKNKCIGCGLCSSLCEEVFEMKDGKAHVKKGKEKSNDSDLPSNRGKLIVDATVAPADIKFPTDLNLLDDARKKCEAVIDAQSAGYSSADPEQGVLQQGKIASLLHQCQRHFHQRIAVALIVAPLPP